MNRKLKVLHVISSMGIGGIQKMFAATVDGLQGRGRSAHLGCIIRGSSAHPGMESRYGRYDFLGVPAFRSYPLIVMARFLGFPLLVLKIIRENPDIIYAYYSPADQLVAALAGKCLGKKVVLRKYGPYSSFNGFERLCFRLAYPISDGIVTVYSGGVAELGSFGIPAHRIFHIPNGKRPMDIAPLRAGARKRLGFRDSDIVIGDIARMDPGKGQHLLVKAFYEIAKSREDVRLCLTCTPFSTPYKSLIEGQIRRYGLGGKVILLDYEEDTRWMLASLDIFAHPVVVEALPGAVIEAAAAGLPVVGSDAGDTRDILYGCGIVVPVRDIPALKEGLEALLKDPKLRRLYGMKARKRVAKLYSEDRMLDSYERMFESLCGKQAARA